MRYLPYALALSVLAWLATAQAFELETEQVMDKVYAPVGDINQRTKENLGLNNTLSQHPPGTTG